MDDANPTAEAIAIEGDERIVGVESFLQWRWHLDEVFVTINREAYYLWRAVNHEDRAKMTRRYYHQNARS